MEYRNFGRTGVQVSPLCLGCMMFGSKTGPEEAEAIIRHALEAGLNFLDTANVYGRGSSEEVTGEILKKMGARDRVFLATKVHGRMEDDDPNAWGNSRRHIIRQCEDSLRRLQTEYIDLYQIHRPQPSVAIDETLGALDDLVRSGKVRYLGTSTFAAWQVVEALWTSRQLGLHRFVCEQPPYNLLDRRIERELIPMAQTYGLALIPWSPLGGGLLTGKYRRGSEAPDGSRFAGRSGQTMLEKRYQENNFNILEPLEAIAAKKEITLSQLALAWVMQRPGITAPIIGPRTLPQLQDNLSAVAVTFTAEELAAIDEIAAPGRMTAPFYEADFGPSRFRL